ncbi:hypothetical protein [Mycolicibacterium vaccae]|uniref:DUF1622 domain-containing protein n=1 Tax=Mycolicibacterium vaccae ATCC 25954 TaxID=1194972 RepID=K0UN19_MYCVA|nr:hypothetical protein [Mycolicibacterium vaccae]ANI39479.1 hypothetical protein MYVA_2298 [Mycolicibacterium vaccae 95051]EJZ06415.1 hypothetical protein MVAC_22105 [Mycolicibacterium vaccae ATCC 25954]MCV7063742.1 hypothetical protein [Mycolicibacterium vaccae]
MTVIIAASWCLAIAGIALGAAALVVFGRPLPALRVTLEFLTAAGLLRLSADSSWTAIAVAAVLIVLRRMITRVLVADFTMSRARRTI